MNYFQTNSDSMDQSPFPPGFWTVPSDFPVLQASLELEGGGEGVHWDWGPGDQVSFLICDLGRSSQLHMASHLLQDKT